MKIKRKSFFIDFDGKVEVLAKSEKEAKETFDKLIDKWYEEDKLLGTEMDIDSIEEGDD